MKSYRNISAVVVCCFTLLALGCSQQHPSAAEKAADEAAIRSVNPKWFKAYNAGNADSIVVLYAQDAVVSAPGAPAARGTAAIRELLNKDVVNAQAAGVQLNSGPTTDVGVSGDLGWEWGTFTVTDKSGATVDKGKYVSVFEKRNGKWLIIRDIWNSDAANQM